MITHGPIQVNDDPNTSPIPLVYDIAIKSYEVAERRRNMAEARITNAMAFLFVADVISFVAWTITSLT